MANEVLIIDHRDSFTYNIVQLVERQTGSRPTVMPYDEVNPEKVSAYSRIILSPGPGLPSDYPVTTQIIHNFLREKPILGICLGHQIIAQFFGADIVRMPQIIHGHNTVILRQGESKLLRHVPREFEAGLYHSWVVRSGTLPETIRVTAISRDSKIMSLEHLDFPVSGVQFHPESFMTREGGKIIDNFIKWKTHD